MTKVEPIIVLIEKNVPLEPRFLDGNISEHILSHLKTMNEPSKEYGHILDIVKIIEYGLGTVSRISMHIIFPVKFLAKTLKPEEGKTIEAEVTMISQYGIFLGIGSLKILVPYSGMKGYTFKPGDSPYFEGKKSIRKGDNLKVRIKHVKFERKTFSCIAELI